MATIYSSGSFKITVYADDHNPPHFHILTPDESIAIELTTFTILKGKMKGKHLANALDWAKEHKDDIWKEWNRVHESEE